MTSLKQQLSKKMICFFHPFLFPSAIRRLVIFIQLLKTTITLFFMPLVTGFAYAILAYLMFGKTIETFSNLKFCYLMVNQYFIKPQAIYHSLTESHPYLGPMFVFILGICVNFFVLNFFIAFLNEAYITIIKRVKKLTAKLLTYFVVFFFSSKYYSVSNSLFFNFCTSTIKYVCAICSHLTLSVLPISTEVPYKNSYQIL